MTGLGSIEAPQALQKSSTQEQLSQQLPNSFASMSASFASPQAMQQAQQAPVGPHDPAWFREAQTSQAQMAAAQSLLSPQQQQHQQLQSQAVGAHNSVLLQHQQQHAVSGAREGLLHLHQQPGQLGMPHYGLLMQQQNQSSNPQDLQQQQLQLPSDVLQAWQQDLQPSAGLSLHQSSGLSQQQSLLLLAAQQQMLEEQMHASKLQWDQQQRQQQLLLAAAALQPLGDTSRPLPSALSQHQQHQAEGACSSVSSFHLA